MTNVKRWVAGAWVLLGIAALGAEAPLSVVATTSIVGDVVAQVGGDRIAVTVLFPPETDPHTFEPTPRDLVVLTRAKLVFINGVGLEEGLTKILEAPEHQGRVVDLSAGLDLRALEEEHKDADEDHGDGDEHDHGGVDPHVWFDPLLVAAWTHRIEEALGAVDPEGKEAFAVRGAAYRRALEDLDAWIQAEVQNVPPERRILVTDHRVLGYFAARYGFEQAGAIIPAFSTLAEPSAKELAALEDTIRNLGVGTVFISSPANPALAERIARDTGVKLVVLFHSSLTGPDGVAPNYLAFMRENVRRIVAALRG